MSNQEVMRLVREHGPGEFQINEGAFPVMGDDMPLPHGNEGDYVSFVVGGRRFVACALTRQWTGDEDCHNGNALLRGGEQYRDSQLIEAAIDECGDPNNQGGVK